MQTHNKITQTALQGFINHFYMKVTFSISQVLLFFVTWLASSSAFAQTDNPMVGLDKWRIHLPYYQGKVVTGGNNVVYCATQYGLFSYNKSDQSLERYSRVTGLSDFEISTIRYSADDHLVLVAYQSANIDLIYDDHTILNLSDITRKNIVGGKGINNILFLNHTAYLSCEFGIVVLDLIRKEIKDTYYIGTGGISANVSQLAYDGSKFYASTIAKGTTPGGIYYADAANPTLFNFESWTKDTTMYQLADPGGSFTSIAAYSGKIFTVYSDTLKLVFDGTTWSDFVSFDHYAQSGFDVYNNYLMLKNVFSVAMYDASLTRVALFYTGLYPQADPKFAFRDADGSYWIADGSNGLVHSSGTAFESLHPNCPSGVGAYAMDSGTEGIWVACGGLIGTGGIPTEEQKGTYWFKDNFWKAYFRENDTIYNSLSDQNTINIAVDPNNGKHAFVGSRGAGVLEYGENGITKVWNQNNSSLKGLDANTVWVGGVDYDVDGNLWAVTNLNSQMLSEYKTDGTWKGFNIGATYADKYVFNLLVDSYNQKWINARGLGLVVFNENDPANPNDDNNTLLTTTAGHGGLPTADIYSLAEDKDQAIWIGSSAGVFVIYNPGNIFSGGNYDAQKVLIEQDGHAQYLLETEYVTAIAVDGANRKWFGTLNSGVFLMSADATKLIHIFNSDNSPLLSNDVQSIAIDPVTGEVFFGTDKGICSYRADATEGGETCDNYFVFPNPVRHEYHGPIAVKGLVKNASVKIADVSGQVVYQTKANGGEAVWDGNNFNGDRAHTGVYMVYVTNEDGSETCVTKVLFTN